VRDEIENKERADYGQFLIKNIAADLNIDQKELYKIVITVSKTFIEGIFNCLKPIPGLSLLILPAKDGNRSVGSCICASLP